MASPTIPSTVRIRMTEPGSGTAPSREVKLVSVRVALSKKLLGSCVYVRTPPSFTPVSVSEEPVVIADANRTEMQLAPLQSAVPFPISSCLLLSVIRPSVDVAVHTTVFVLVFMNVNTIFEKLDPFHVKVPSPVKGVRLPNCADPVCQLEMMLYVSAEARELETRRRDAANRNLKLCLSMRSNVLSMPKKTASSFWNI